MASVTTVSDRPGYRLRADERRELVLEAATGVFGERGYVGATTERIARAARVSQPYVIRIFGSKESLFLAVLERALDRLLATLRAAFDGAPAGIRREELHHRLGGAYVDLLADRGLQLSLMHAFVLGSDPRVGPVARRGFLEVYRLLRDEAGLAAPAATEFLARGMLLNTLVGLRMAEDIDDPAARELIETIAPSKSELLVRLAREVAE